jgi:hypothetical protein
MKSSDDKTNDTSSLAVKERRLQTNTVLKELLQVTPPMAPDEMNESESTQSFVVPDYLIAGVEEMKEVYPEASDEELASILKYS